MKDNGLIKSHKNAIMTVLGSMLLVSGVVLLVFWPDIFETIKFKVNIYPKINKYSKMYLVMIRKINRH